MTPKFKDLKGPVMPPSDPRDAAGWDRHWIDVAKSGYAGFFEMLNDDRDLIRVMRGEGMNRILCAGSGVSVEPQVLAEVGFTVSAVEISEWAVKISQALGVSPQGVEHYCGAGMEREGGSVEFVVGDLLDPAVCPGPYDVILERRTAQIYHGDGMDEFMNALISRLDENGIFFSHCHDGGWTPDRERWHFPGKWFEENGWTIWRDTRKPKPPGRVAWLLTSTG